MPIGYPNNRLKPQKLRDGSAVSPCVETAEHGENSLSSVVELLSGLSPIPLPRLAYGVDL